MKTSLIITTYNRPDALEAVLVSILQQKRLPQEVVIADDGSTDVTRNLILSYQNKFPMPLIHSWHQDNGFRLAESRNKAIAKTTSEYIIMIDGDMILHPLFVFDHIHHAKKGTFIQGSRVMFSESKTRVYLASPNLYKPIHWYQQGVETRLEKRLSACRIPLFTNLFMKETIHNHKAIRGCNMSFFKEDVIKVNGFNNKFVGWGREDSEFVERLFNRGIKRRNIKFAAIAYHLYHKEEPRASLKENDILLQKAINEKLSYCDDGLNKFLAN